MVTIVWQLDKTQKHPGDRPLAISVREFLGLFKVGDLPYKWAALPHGLESSTENKDKELSINLPPSLQIKWDQPKCSLPPLLWWALSSAVSPEKLLLSSSPCQTLAAAMRKAIKTCRFLCISSPHPSQEDWKSVLLRGKDGCTLPLQRRPSHIH